MRLLYRRERRPQFGPLRARLHQLLELREQEVASDRGKNLRGVRYPLAHSLALQGHYALDGKCYIVQDESGREYSP